MASKNTINVDELRIGWYRHNESPDGGTPAATLLRNEGDQLTLSVPISQSDTFGSIVRWFSGSGHVYADDPDKKEYSYSPPEEILFTDTRGPVGLFGCRSMGMKEVLGGDAEGRIRVGIAVLGAPSLEHSSPHRVRTYIPGMGRWIRVSSVRIEPEKHPDGRVSRVSIRTLNVDSLDISEGVTLGCSWHINCGDADNELTVSDPPFVETFFEEGASFYDHHRKHKMFRDLVALSYWKPTGYSRIQSSRRGEERLGSPQWKEVETYLFRRQFEKHSGLPLFAFGDIGPEGYRKWEEMCQRYERVVAPIVSLLGMGAAPIETQFIQSCVALEGLGVQLARDVDFFKYECLELRLRRISEDVGFAFSDDWAARTAKTYNDIKHYDRDTQVDPLDVYYSLLENELMFRSWSALRLGISEDEVKRRIETMPSGQSLVRQPWIKFPKAPPPEPVRDDSE